jgi:predicted DNA-binding transcriptional regulator AlpA
MSLQASPEALGLSNGRQGQQQPNGTTVDHDEDDEFEFLNINDAAKLLGIPVATLRWWRSKGTGPRSIKFGRHVKYPKVALRRWIQSQQGRGDPAE